jgi:hypothetical protein
MLSEAEDRHTAGVRGKEYRFVNGIAPGADHCDLLVYDFISVTNGA